MNISASLKKIRSEKNLTLKELSNKTGIPYRTYQNYELELRVLSIENAFKLAKFYNISIEKLCTYDS